MRTTSRTLRPRTGTPSRLHKPGSLTHAHQSHPARWALLLLPLAAALLIVLWATNTQPHPLNDYTLAGARSPACLRIIVIRDQSGSMRGYETARDDAMRTLIHWSTKPDTLRPDDELAIIDFGATADIALPTTTVGNLNPTPPPPAPIDGSESDINTAIASLAQLPTTMCTTTLIVLSDGLINPLTKASTTQLQQHQITHLTLIQPDTNPAPTQWTTAFPYSNNLNAPPNNANQTSIIIAHAIATATNQQLQQH